MPSVYPLAVPVQLPIMFGMADRVAADAGVAVGAVPDEVVVHPQANTMRTNRITISTVFMGER